MEVLRFAREFRLGIFFLYREINNLEIKILGKKYISGKLFTCRNRLENVFKSDLRSPF